MQKRPQKIQFPLRPVGSSPNVTSAVGMEETAGRSRARRNSLFTKTIIWVTGLICLAFLLASLVQAWSNYSLMQRVQVAQQQIQQLQSQRASLTKLANHYKNPFVIERNAREQLGYIRPGEHPVVIMSSTSQAQPGTAHHDSAPVQQGYWQEWWNIFFGS